MMKDELTESKVSQYTYHLEEQEFEGPLDLLLTMIKEAKIDIRDIFISDITNQFVTYVQNLPEKDYEYMAEYIAMAATLIAIKSAKFLPKANFDEEEIDILEQDEEILYLRIEAYKKFKEAAEKLQTMETLYRFYRKPQFTEKDFRAVAKGFDLEKLIECFKALLDRIEHLDKGEEEKTIIKERFTIADKILEMTRLIQKHKRLSFYSLFKQDYSKTEMINTFLALLEILKKQIAYAEQAEGFSDIIIYRNENTKIELNDHDQEELIRDVKEYN